MVTRAFEDQESWLTRADFAAAAICLSEIDGLVFYNAGAAAGASQPHKHLQLVTLPFTEGGPRIPIETILGAAEFRGGLGKIATLPFLHALIRFDGETTGSPGQAVEVMTTAYRSLLSAVGADGTEPHRLVPYNLLVTREWMLMVPRARERYRSISVNALGFAGSLFVRNHEQLDRLKCHGPVAVLSRVGRAR